MFRIARLSALALGALVLGGCASTETREPQSQLPDVIAPTIASPVAAEASWQPAARSVEDRTIETRVVGSGPRKVLWVGGIHGDEREGSIATEALAGAFLAYPDLAQRVTLTLIRDLNPDGSAAKRRSNARHVDLNRNFPARNYRATHRNGSQPLDQPESQFLHSCIEGTALDLVIVCHSSRRGESFVNYDGPAHAFASRFSQVSGYPIVESDKLHSTPGSLGSWVGIDRNTPILTLEYRRGMDPAQAWDDTREAILATLAMP